MSSSINLFSLARERKKGGHTLKNLKRYITKLLPELEGVELAYTGTKLGNTFNFKHKTNKELQSSI